MCIELFNNIAETDPRTSSAFFQQFFIPILQDIFFVLTDTDHKAGFKNQAMLLSRMFHFVESGKIQAPLYTPDQAPVGTPNSEFLRNYVATLLQNAFSHLKPAQVKLFVDGLFTLHGDLTRFKLNLRDFLIQLKEFSGGDNTELYAEEREAELEARAQAERERASKVGGLIKPSEMADDDLL